METRVRQLGEHDWPLLRTIRLRALRDSPSTFETDAADAAEWPSSEWQKWLRTAAVFAATQGTAGHGMVSSAPRASPGDRGLAAMWVAPERRGRHTGTELLHAHLAWARRDGGSRVTLWVSSANTTACRLYTTFGFGPTGSTAGGRHGELVELAIALCAPDA